MRWLVKMAVSVYLVPIALWLVLSPMAPFEKLIAILMGLGVGLTSFVLTLAAIRRTWPGNLARELLHDVVYEAVHKVVHKVVRKLVHISAHKSARERALDVPRPLEFGRSARLLMGLLMSPLASLHLRRFVGPREITFGDPSPQKHLNADGK